jgi:hypothetical protein
LPQVLEHEKEFTSMEELMADVKKDDDNSGKNTYRPVSQAFNLLPGLANRNNANFGAARNTEY